jgi:hypothetical protein
VLHQLLRRTGVMSWLSPLWLPEIDRALKPVRKEVRRLTSEVADLERQLQRTAEQAQRADRIVAQIRLTAVLNQQQHARLADVTRLLNEERVTSHVRAAIEATPLRTDPYEHVVVERLLPDDVYELLLDAIPPVAFFQDRDPIKQDLRFPLEFGPTLPTAVWTFFDDVVAARAITPAALEKFREPLRRHFDTIFGPAFLAPAERMALAPSGGRLMLRRPGYHLAPHRDPKHSLLTCLLYLARPGDSDTYGTQIFSVVNDTDASYKQTYYPEEEGRRCELVRVVPFKANSMLIFLNSRGAHGATIPATAPAGLERYSYQFYVAPEKQALASVIKALPDDRRIMWQQKPTPATLEA